MKNTISIYNYWPIDNSPKNENKIISMMTKVFQVELIRL